MLQIKAITLSPQNPFTWAYGAFPQAEKSFNLAGCPLFTLCDSACSIRKPGSNPHAGRGFLPQICRNYINFICNDGETLRCSIIWINIYSFFDPVFIPGSNEYCSE